MPENVNVSALCAEQGEVVDDRPVMVRVDHVSMVFNKASEQLNNLKEYAIKLARRELFFEGFKALDNVSFEVRKGDVFGIMGTNGSGKSTMLKIIAGVLEPSSGTCEINGNIAPLIELGAGFDQDLTARENIYLNGALLGYSKEFIDSHFDEIVDFAEVESFLDMPLKNYSSGMVARIAFAIATVIVPEILVVDEVLSVGDFMFQKKCEDRINDLIEKHGVTVLIVSHSNEQIARLCNKAIWIEKGHARLQGDASTVARVYGGLGGREGSFEAEQIVFEELVKAREEDLSDDSLVVIPGEDACAVSANLICREWREHSLDSVAIYFDGTHANAVMANPLAGALGAPVLPCKADYIPESVERILAKSKPRNVYFFDCENRAVKVRDSLRERSWGPEVVPFSGRNVFAMSKDIYEYGEERGLWEKGAVFFDFADPLESLCASPFLYAEKRPVFMFPPAEHLDDDVALFAGRWPSDEIVVFGPAAKKKIEAAGFVDGVNFVGGSAELSSSCLEISRFVRDCFASAGPAGPEVCISSLSVGRWPELTSCGSYAGSKRIPLLLMDERNLDSIASCVGYLRESSCDAGILVCIGERSGLTQAERVMLCRALQGF